MTVHDIILVLLVTQVVKDKSILIYSFTSDVYTEIVRKQGMFANEIEDY